jgi:DNA-binding GntR family transcriptional regulator
MNIEPARFQPKTAADMLAARLRDRLFDGAFAPGETISIRRIAEAEGVSVIPARDAMRGFVAEGALEFRDARTIVVPILDEAALDEICYARLTLEAELSDRAYPQLLGQIDALSQLDDAVSAAILESDIALYMAANRAFHFQIYRAANAPILLKLAEALWLRIGPSFRFVVEAFAGNLPSADFHQTAIAALKAEDQAGFRAAIEHDIAQGMDKIIERAKRTQDAQ